MNEKRADHFAHGMEMPDSVVDYPQIGQRIKRLRNQRGMTQEVLAEATSLSVPYISHLERAVKKGSLETLTRIAAALGVTVHELLGIPRSEKEAFLPDMTSVLEDCSPEERKFLLELTLPTAKPGDSWFVDDNLRDTKASEELHHLPMRYVRVRPTLR